jgi:membrane-associated phospholipid phosphatase
MNDAAPIAAQDRQSLSMPRLARAISRLGHPLVFISLTVGLLVLMRLPNRTGLLVLLTLLVSIVLPIALLLFRGVRKGHWRDADVSVREERKRFYPRAIPFSVLSIVLLWLLNAPGFVLRGAIVTLALFIVAGIANLRIKLSLHALFAFYCATMLFQAGPIFGGSALLLALLVSWSRLYLRRHRLDEMITGALLGIAGGIATAWWP